MKKTKTPPFDSNFRALDDRALRDQLRRAVSSIPLNLAEGYGLQGGHEKQRFLTALGSAREVAAIIEVARRWEYVSSADADDALQALDRVAAMTYRLVHPRTAR